jgi:uncharacterized surface protein with fasciclin (FAS1) repeats
MTIIQIASNAGSFKALIAALKAARLSESLSGPGPFTVFAPCDDAFAKLPVGTMEGLLKDTIGLPKILTYHIIYGEINAKDIMTMKYAKTVQGEDVTITVKNGCIIINNAKVIQADIECSNGVIHAIDTILRPK